MNDAKQTDLMEELGVKVADRKTFRDKYLSPGDWYKAGKVVMIRPSGIVKLRVAVEEPGLVAEIVELRICRTAPNPRFVYVNVDGKACPCVIPVRLSGFLKAGKLIRCQVIRDKDGVSYRHELAG